MALAGKLGILCVHITQILEDTHLLGDILSPR